MAKAELWVVYDHPKDEPMHFVARRWEIAPGAYAPTNDVMLDHDLERLRQRLQDDKKVLSRLPRHPNDDPTILETWMS